MVMSFKTFLPFLVIIWERGFQIRLRTLDITLFIFEISSVKISDISMARNSRHAQYACAAYDHVMSLTGSRKRSTL